MQIPHPIDSNWLEQWFREYNTGNSEGTAGAGDVVVLDSNKNVLGFGMRHTMLAAGGTKTLTAADNNKIVQLDTAAGSTVTLPAATGTGAFFRFYVSALATSNAHIVKCAGSDVFVGIIWGCRVDSSNAVLGFAAASNSNTITLDRSNGSVSKGEWIEVFDVATGVWKVKGMLTSTGSAFATPFSNA